MAKKNKNDGVVLTRQDSKRALRHAANEPGGSIKLATTVIEEAADQAAKEQDELLDRVHEAGAMLDLARVAVYNGIGGPDENTLRQKLVYAEDQWHQACREAGIM